MAFAYYRTVTIDKDLVSGDQTDFPVLISGTYAYLKTVGNGGDVQNANGYDIVFYTDATAATKLDHEIESYDATTGAVVFWVRIPSLSSSVDTVIYMFYGDEVFSSQENKTGVWDSNYKGVWHLGDGTTLNANDSTMNVNNGAVTGSAAATAKIGGGASFNGTTDLINCGSNASVDNIKAASAFMISAWIKPTTVGESTAGGYILSKVSFAGFTGWIFNVLDTAAIRFFHYAGAVSVIRTSNNSSITYGSWQHVAITWDGSTTAANVHIYVNGAEVGYATTTNGTSITSDAANDLIIGNENTVVRTFDGLIDEVRISNLIRSTGWITTEYNNQSDPATFYAISSATNAIRSITGVTSLTGVTSITF